MCGISGILGKNSSEELLDRMITIQEHRGPDAKGKWVNNNIALGHNRLAIIDIGTRANQPFFSADKRFILVFNGEIYNYLELRSELGNQYNFTTNSDTEVLLAAYILWGNECLHKFNGMFSFAIWDCLEKTLFIARDRFGVKPLYYHQSDDTFSFASEIKALHAIGIPKTPNETTWASYFVYGSYGLPDETFWQNIEQLPGGHYLKIVNGVVSVSKWYCFEKEIKKHKSREDFETVKENYTALLKDSINLRFRADVNVGFNVSGGLDSSALLTFVNKLPNSERIQAYTFYTGDIRYDELPWVENMLSTTKCPLKKVKLSSDEVMELTRISSFYQDEPFGGIPTLAYSKIFELARRENSLVLLDGQGMDEQWAGYDYYTQISDVTIQGVKESPFRPNVFKKSFIDKAKKPSYPKPFSDEILNKQYRDLFYTKIPRALRFNDRISMTHSTELREPFLDYRLVEYAFAQPIEYKIKDGIQKHLLREIVSNHLNDTITYAPKRPLQTPQREWLANELKEEVTKIIRALKSSKFNHWFNFDDLNEEWSKYLNGEQNSSFHIWQWINFFILFEDNSRVENLIN